MRTWHAPTVISPILSSRPPHSLSVFCGRCVWLTGVEHQRVRRVLDIRYFNVRIRAMRAIDPASKALKAFQAISCFCSILYGLTISYQVTVFCAALASKYSYTPAKSEQEAPLSQRNRVTRHASKFEQRLTMYGS